MYKINISKLELAQTIVDYISETYGEKSLDKIDPEQLAEDCKHAIYKAMETMLTTASNQAKRGRHSKTNYLQKPM